MAVYRSARDTNDYSRNRKQQYFLDTEDRYRCSCGNKCDEKCRHESRNESEFDYNFNNNDNDHDDATVSQDGEQYAFMEQESAELIWVKESCDITINTTDTQAGVSLQAGLQLAIALVLRITIGDSDQSEAVSQELMQQFDMTQSNKQKIYIYNTKDATVTTTDTDLAINIQVLLQLLVALIIIVDIL
ncbi:spore coat protein [Oceanobacillus rekensis]|uniref:spore coat protein n=1 Tax=Oceanobacillus rekensis TaxID=937927 RepID=UPI000B43C9FA|nr:spore coat protein [Oceanobacillus rekensis]